MSFRGRLLATSLAALAAGLGAAVLIANVLLDQRVRAEESSLLNARMEAQLAALDVTPNGVRARKTTNDEQLDKRAWVFDGRRVIERPSTVPRGVGRLAIALGRAHARTEREARHDFTLRAEPVRAPGGGAVKGAVVVALDGGPLERLQKEVAAGSLVVAGLILVAAALAIRRAITGALAPIMRMTRSAEAWGARDLEHRFDIGPVTDELTGLAATLDGLLERIAASRRHEQRFAGDAAHELRTPLAGLRGRAELALAAEGPDGDAERREALRGIVAQADRLDATIDALLALARQELDPASGTVDLAELAREHEDPDGAPLVETRVSGAAPLAGGEPDVVRRALAPLVDNARRHAASQVCLDVTLEGSRARVVVRDDGPGLPPASAKDVFEPGVRLGERNGSAGLGLPLARRLARSCGGDVVAGEAEQGGCFVLELPAVRRQS